MLQVKIIADAQQQAMILAGDQRGLSALLSSRRAPFVTRQSIVILATATLKVRGYRSCSRGEEPQEPDKLSLSIRQTLDENSGHRNTSAITLPGNPNATRILLCTR